jgi:hypothetical protein
VLLCRRRSHRQPKEMLTMSGNKIYAHQRLLRAVRLACPHLRIQVRRSCGKRVSMPPAALDSSFTVTRKRFGTALLLIPPLKFRNLLAFALLDQSMLSGSSSSSLRPPLRSLQMRKRNSAAMFSQTLGLCSVPTPALIKLPIRCYMSEY